MICKQCGTEYFAKECFECKKRVVVHPTQQKNRKRVRVQNIESIDYTNNQKASFLIRLMAVLIDILILGLPLSFFMGNLIAQLLIALITIALWIFWNGQTIGKKLLSIKIVNAYYGDISIQDAIKRYIGYIASTVTLFIGYAMIAFREDNRGLHDIIANTQVIYTDPNLKSSNNDTIEQILSVLFLIVSIPMMTGYLIFTMSLGGIKKEYIQELTFNPAMFDKEMKYIDEIDKDIKSKVNSSVDKLQDLRKPQEIDMDKL